MDQHRQTPGIIVHSATQSSLNDDLENVPLQSPLPIPAQDNNQNRSSAHGNHHPLRADRVIIPRYNEQTIPPYPIDRPGPSQQQHQHESRGRKMLSVISGASSPRSSPSPSPPRQLLAEAIRDEDFQELREGLDYALGSSNKDPNWFPVSAPYRQPIDETNRTLQENTDPVADIYNEDFTTDIPMQNLRQRRPSYLSRRHSRGSSRISPTENIYDTHSNTNSTGYFDRLDPNQLESGTYIHHHPQHEDGSASPKRITRAITRISDRIAGAGSRSKQNEEERDNRTSVSPHLHPIESHPSLLTPTNVTFTDYVSDRLSPVHFASDRLSPVHFASRSHLSVPDISINTGNASSYTQGLGLPVDKPSEKTPLREETHEVRPLPSPVHSHVIIDQLRIHSHNKKRDSVSSVEDLDANTMYLFGNSLGIFSPQSKIRQLCHRLFEHRYTNFCLLILLILQVGLLSYRHWDPDTLGGYVGYGYNWADYCLMVINILYTAEIFGKIIAYGFINDRVMYEELGLPYPVNELKQQYFGRNYVWQFFIWLGIPKLFNKKKNNNNVRFAENNKPYNDSSTPLRDYSSDETDIKEVNLEEEPIDLKQKYNGLRLHHGGYTRVGSITSDEIKLNYNEPRPTNKPLESKNTFLKPKTHNTFLKLHLKRAYLRSSWHRIDFISMIAFWISLFLSIDHYDAKHKILIFRALSCLRILRLCNLTAGTHTILTACKTAFPQLIDVAIFISCFWLFFAIIGVQSFKSSLTRHCVWTNPNDPNDQYINSGQYCGSYLAPDGTRMPFIERDGTASDEIKGFTCPVYSQCISGKNPYGGSVSFDNIFHSLEMVFVVMSANTFTDIMYDTMDSDSMVACLFFIVCIFIMTVWLINVFIAVIVESFNITREEVAKERKRNREGGGIFNFFGTDEQGTLLYSEKLTHLKQNKPGLRFYYRFELIFIFLICADLFVQCFRRYDMSDTARHTLYRFEAVFTAIFLFEIIVRFLVYLPHWGLFFTFKRNWFDLFLAIVTSVIIIDPVKNALGQLYYWLTVFQLMRFYRVVLATSITRHLWMKIMWNIRALCDLTLFFFILLGCASIIFTVFFEATEAPDEAGEEVFLMNTLPDSFVALYIVTSTENWTEILYNLQEITTNTFQRVMTAVLFIFWFILSNMIVMNIFIAVIAKTLEVSETGKRKQQLLQFIDTMTNKLHSINDEIGMLSKIKKKLFKRNQPKDELEKAVVNLLLSGTAVNDFLDDDDIIMNKKNVHETKIRELPESSWQRWFYIKYWRIRDSFNNPFYDDVKKNEISLEDFNPATFAKDIIQERKVLVEKQNQFLQENPKFNYVFYMIGPHHRLRRICQRMVKPSHGERIDGVAPYRKLSEAIVVIFFLATIGLVVTACYMTPIFRREMVEEYGSVNWTFWLELAFTLFFTLEFLVKVIADGLIFTPNAYARSSWNIIDMVVLVSLWIEVIAFMRDDGNLSRVVRGLKALRALRLLTISETAKANFHNTMIVGFWKIISAMIISLCLLFPFSIWGLNIFNGRLGFCINGDGFEGCYNEYENQVFNWNILSPKVYTHGYLYFDKFTTSFATLFEIVSLEGWVDLLNSAISSTGVGTAPNWGASPWNGIYVILFNFLSIVFILTLFVSVIINNYLETTGRAYLTPDQIAWYQVKQILVQTKPSKRKDLNRLSFFKKFCYKMTVERNKVWTRILNFTLFLHVLALLLECYPSGAALDDFRSVIYMIAASMFLMNAIMLFVARGSSFWHFKWNVFNSIVSLGAFITTIIGFTVDPDSTFMNFNKLFLVGLLLFIIPRSNRLNQLLKFASASLPNLISLMFTWIVLFLLFAIAMNQIFGLTKIGPNGTDNINLRSVPKALILLFRCSFGEGWNYIMDDYTLEPPFCTSEVNIDSNDCGKKQYAYILFIAWNIISMYILLNMFISLILDSFSYISHKSGYSDLIQREEIRKFKRTWQEFDSEGTGYIKPIELPKFLHKLDGALSFHFYSGSLSIPYLCKQWVKRNNPNNPYDVTVNFDAIEQTMNQMDIDKIRERRNAYEMFIEEALLTMELNEDPGISFTRILLQLPLYTSFDAGQCLNLIDFLERRLLVQKVQKRLYTKRVYETIASYACRWKYKKDKTLGISTTDIAFDSKLKRNSYLTNEKLRINNPTATSMTTEGSGGRLYRGLIHVPSGQSLLNEDNVHLINTNTEGQSLVFSGNENEDYFLQQPVRTGLVIFDDMYRTQRTEYFPNTPLPMYKKRYSRPNLKINTSGSSKQDEEKDPFLDYTDGEKK